MLLKDRVSDFMKDSGLDAVFVQKMKTVIIFPDLRDQTAFYF